MADLIGHLVEQIEELRVAREEAQSPGHTCLMNGAASF
jgi:hypothetical protein